MFSGILSRMMYEHRNNPDNPRLAGSRSLLLRSLFSVGLLCKHFDFDSEEFKNETSVSEKLL